ncbi:MAG TPA: hypothetical protein V6C95_20330 [Coleofasciculaceae cyanobacterium]
MNPSNFPTSACRVCRFYQPEGRRGGMCQQLGVPVSASWKACSLALPPFAPSWESLEALWQNDKIMLKESLSIHSSPSSASPNYAEEKTAATAESLAADVMLV